jgi:hypothetical protein
MENNNNNSKQAESYLTKKINSKCETYFMTFKDEIRSKVIELNFDQQPVKPKLNELLEFVYEYDRLTFSKDDLSKRKRIQNSIPTENRCNAKRADNRQCTRKRKDGCEFCGTHSKGAPHGIATDSCGTCTKNISVTAIDIMGIVYYIDKFNNVYKTEDILENKLNPEIIAKCSIINGKYCIPQFGLV